MKDLAPVALAGFGAGLFAAQMPSPLMAFGGIIALIGIILPDLRLHLRFGLPGRTTLVVTRERGRARRVYAPAVLGCLMGGAAGFAPLPTSITLMDLGLAVGVIASLSYRIETPQTRAAR